MLQKSGTICDNEVLNKYNNKILKQLIKDGLAKYPVNGGDDSQSQGALVPIKELMNYEK